MGAYPKSRELGLSVSARARIKQIFLQVCDLEPESRSKRLEEVCGADCELRQEVERWLRHDSKSSIFDSSDPSVRSAAGEDPFARSAATADLPAFIPDPWIGRIIQSYKLLALAGRGGMGEVYRAEDIRLNRPVAVKLLRSYLLGDDRQKGRFLREAQAAASLDHPSICPVYDVGEIEGRPYIVTAYVEGDSLARSIPPSGFSLVTALDYAIQMGEGLQAAHLRGIVHRDMKPDNVILASKSGQGLQVKIIDFGLSQISGSTELTDPGQVIGTAAYIAPEILKGEPADQRSDVWALGVILCEMLSGYPPFDAENRERLFYMICHEEPAPLTAECPDLPEEAAQIAAKALAKDRTARYQSIGALLEDLVQLSQQISRVESAPPAAQRPLATRNSLPPDAVKSTTPPPPTARSSKTKGRWLGLAAAGVLMIVSAVWLKAVRGRPDAPTPSRAAWEHCRAGVGTFQAVGQRA